MTDATVATVVTAATAATGTGIVATAVGAGDVPAHQSTAIGRAEKMAM